MPFPLRSILGLWPWALQWTRFISPGWRGNAGNHGNHDDPHWWKTMIPLGRSGFLQHPASLRNQRSWSLWDLLWQSGDLRHTCGHLHVVLGDCSGLSELLSFEFSIPVNFEWFWGKPAPHKLQLMWRPSGAVNSQVKKKRTSEMRLAYPHSVFSTLAVFYLLGNGPPLRTAWNYIYLRWLRQHIPLPTPETPLWLGLGSDLTPVGWLKGEHLDTFSGSQNHIFTLGHQLRQQHSWWDVVWDFEKMARGIQKIIPHWDDLNMLHSTNTKHRVWESCQAFCRAALNAFLLTPLRNSFEFAVSGCPFLKSSIESLSRHFAHAKWFRTLTNSMTTRAFKREMENSGNLWRTKTTNVTSMYIANPAPGQQFSLWLCLPCSLWRLGLDELGIFGETGLAILGNLGEWDAMIFA